MNFFQVLQSFIHWTKADWDTQTLHVFRTWWCLRKTSAMAIQWNDKSKRNSNIQKPSEIKTVSSNIYTCYKVSSSEDGSPMHLAGELRALSRYHHENIVALYGYAMDGDEVCLVYQYMVNGSLQSCLHGQVTSWFYNLHVQELTYLRLVCRTISNDVWSKKMWKITLRHNANKRTETFVFCWLRSHVMFDVMCSPEFVGVSDVNSSALLIH